MTKKTIIVIFAVASLFIGVMFFLSKNKNAIVNKDAKNPFTIIQQQAGKDDINKDPQKTKEVINTLNSQSSDRADGDNKPSPAFPFGN